MPDTTMPDHFARAEKKALAKPDETRSFDHGKVDLVNLAGGTVGRFELQPGWQWSKHVRPIARTQWCENPHFGYQVSGRMRVKMSNGEEFELGPGEVGTIPPGHDAWVVGDEPVVTIDWTGATNYALAAGQQAQDQKQAGERAA